jgi:glycosyltransferase involved in cell wall biosynthesis
MGEKAFLIRSTEAYFEPRFMEARKLLVDLGFEVVIINWNRSGMMSSTMSIDNCLTFHKRAPYGRGLKNFRLHWEFAKFIQQSISRDKPHLIYCCDLDTLIPTLFTRLSEIVLFDQFDPISARFELPNAISAIVDFLEVCLSLQAKIRVVANRKRVPRILRNHVTEILNYIPIERDAIVSKRDHSRKGKSHILFYGGTLSADRGIEGVIQAVKGVLDWRLQIFGFGPEKKRLTRNIHKNVEINDALEHNALMQYASQASAILALYDPKKRNNRLTASNKLFEACQLGVPIITNSGTSLAQIVTEYGLGLTVEYDDIHSISQALESVGRMSVLDLSLINRNMKAFLNEKEIELAQARVQLKKRIRNETD